MSPRTSRAGGRTSLARLLHQTLGTPGLVIAGLSVLMFVSGLFVISREYNRLSQSREESLRRLISRWVRTASADYLGSRNLVDDAESWRLAPPGHDAIQRAAVADRLDALGRWFEEQNAKAPNIEVVAMWLRVSDGRPALRWQSRTAGTAETRLLQAIPVLPAGDRWPAVSLDVRYRIESGVAQIGDDLETSYRRLLLAVLGLSGYSMLCLFYMGTHAHALHQRATREAAREATLDLADRTCHELGNVAFVLSNERRNLSDHLTLVERFLDEEPDALAAATRRAGLDQATADRLRQALRREYERRGIDPDLELRGGASMARDVCRQIAVCSDYIALTIRELDGYLKQSTMPVALGPVDVNGCLNDAQALLGPSLDSALVRIERDHEGSEPPIAWADRRLLVHALVNLLKNAVEATRETGVPPRLTLRTSLTGPTIRVQIQDNGPGIAPETLPRIFDAGFSTKGVGRGRGLSIVKDSIEAQGGTLRVESRPGQGTTFQIDLARARGER